MAKSPTKSRVRTRRRRRTNERSNYDKSAVAQSPSAPVDLLTTSQAADLLGVSARTFRRHLAQGKITPYSKSPGGHPRFHRADLESFRTPAQASPLLKAKRERIEELNLEFQEKKAKMALQELTAEEQRRAEREEEERQAQEEYEQRMRSDAEADAVRRERERAQARAAARSAQARQEWEAEWMCSMLRELPVDISPELRLDISNLIRQELADLYENAGHAEDIVETTLRAVVQNALQPWRHVQEGKKAAAEALDELPLLAKNAWGVPSQWERRAREEAIEAIKALPETATYQQMVRCARNIGRQIAREYNHDEDCTLAISRMRSSIPARLRFISSEERARATEIAESGIRGLAVGATRADFDKVIETVLQPFVGADQRARADYEAEQQRAQLDAEAERHLSHVCAYLLQLQRDPDGWDFEDKLYDYSRTISREIKPDLVSMLPLDFLAGQRRVQQLVDSWLERHSVEPS